MFCIDTKFHALWFSNWNSQNKVFKLMIEDLRLKTSFKKMFLVFNCSVMIKVSGHVFTASNVNDGI